jgi:hypothetical protein
MNKFICLVLLSMTFIALCSAQRPSLITQPPSNVCLCDRFFSRCSNPRLSGNFLLANCAGRSQSARYTNCIKNYDGTLSPFDGRNREMFSRNCRVQGANFVCECQQTNGSFRSCSISLDRIFFVRYGLLRC